MNCLRHLNHKKLQTFDALTTTKYISSETSKVLVNNALKYIHTHGIDNGKKREGYLVGESWRQKGY